MDFGVAECVLLFLDLLELGFSPTEQLLTDIRALGPLISMYILCEEIEIANTLFGHC